MNKIRVLSENVANKIAAGEVVERPASVIKELVENSIDAGASFITVEITDGGLSYMRVSDNGIGMSKDDAKNCFLRHATSKIHDTDDLFSIATLGFRGEAMASIAAVSRVTLKTHRKSEDFGTLVNIDGGTIREIKECGCPDGTSVEVTDLFFNVPARMKFMKAARTEASYVSDYVLRMILAHPEIRIKYVSNGVIQYNSKGDDNLKNAIYSVYGAELIPHLRKVTYDDGYLSITGYICSDQITKSNRTYQSLFINGRYIRSQKLSFALQNAYNTRIMTGRFPIAVLTFELDYGEVDVNVHPNKLEVKFSDEQRVSSALYTAAKEALGSTSVPVCELPTENQQEEEPLRVKPNDDEKADLFRILMSQANIIDDRSISENKSETSDENIQSPLRDNKNIQSMSVKDTLEELSFFPTFTTTSTKEDNYREEKETLTQVQFDASPYQILGCVFDSFWLICQNENLFVLDQHAAHERILYEEAERGELKAHSQPLLFPFTVKLTGEEFNTYVENQSLFEEFGFEIEPFGTLTLRILAVPHILSKAEDDVFFRDTLAQLGRQKGVTLNDMKKEVLIRASCKAAVKLGNTVPKRMIESILDEYTESGTPLTCPHGRPVMIAITKKDLFKRFKRIL